MTLRVDVAPLPTRRPFSLFGGSEQADGLEETRFDQVATTNADVVEALLWSALPTLIVSRRIYNLVRANALPEHRARYTPLRWASKFRWAAPHILSLTLAQLGGKDANDHDRRVVNLFLTREAIDPHVNRRRLLPRWTA